MKQVMIIAAEASSALFAQRLIEYWKSNKKEIKSFGVGSEAMENLGFERFGQAEEMAVVGVAEIYEHWGKLKAIFYSLIEQAKTRKPSVVILMDYPEFNLRLAKEISALGIPVVYYISPQIWAWRKGRVETIKKYCKKILVLFHFEIEFYKSKNVPVHFVGHPILDELNEKYLDRQSVQLQRSRRGILEDDIVIGLMPGSRNGELKQHFKIQLEVARQLCLNYSKVKILILVAPTFSKEKIQYYLEGVRFPYILMKQEPFEMISLTDFVLVASGTATLMVGLLKKPMVIMYRMKWLTGLIAKVIVRGVKYFGLVNLVLGSEIVPERLQSAANADELYQLIKKYIDNPDYTQKIVSELEKIPQFLGEKGATVRVAEILEEFL